MATITHQGTDAPCLLPAVALLLVISLPAAAQALGTDAWIKQPGTVYVCEGQEVSVLWRYDASLGEFDAVYIHKLRPEWMLLVSMQKDAPPLTAPRFQLANTSSGFTVSQSKMADTGEYEIEIFLKANQQMVSIVDQARLEVLSTTEPGTAAYCGHIHAKTTTAAEPATTSGQPVTMADQLPLTVSSSGSSVAAIIGIIALVLVVLATVTFFVWYCRVYSKKESRKQDIELGRQIKTLSCCRNPPCLRRGTGGKEATSKRAEVDFAEAEENIQHRGSTASKDSKKGNSNDATQGFLGRFPCFGKCGGTGEANPPQQAGETQENGIPTENTPALGPGDRSDGEGSSDDHKSSPASMRRLSKSDKDEHGEAPPKPSRVGANGGSVSGHSSSENVTHPTSTHVTNGKSEEDDSKPYRIPGEREPEKVSLLRSAGTSSGAEADSIRKMSSAGSVSSHDKSSYKETGKEAGDGKPTKKSCNVM